MDDIKAAIDELNSVWNKSASKMYEEAKTEETAESGKKESKKKSKADSKDDKEIEDADFEVVD